MMGGPILSSSGGAGFREPIGWPLLPVSDGDGRLRYPSLDLSIRQRVEAVLRTSPGEQLMRPGFGAGLELLVHQPNTAQVRAETQERVGEAVRAFEPRITVDRISVTPGADLRDLQVTIAYRIRATGAVSRISARVPVGGG